MNPPPESLMSAAVKTEKALSAQIAEHGGARSIEEAFRSLSPYMPDEPNSRFITLPELQAIVAEQVEAERRQRELAERNANNLVQCADNLARELVAHREKAQNNYWAWQGDGEDHLESLSVQCPVLISAKQLKEIIDGREAAEKKIKPLVEALENKTEPILTWSEIVIKCRKISRTILKPYE